MKKVITCIVFLTALLFLGAWSVGSAQEATPYASDDINSASVSLSSRKVISYTLVATRLDTSIKVNYCYLYKKNDNGDWAYKASLTNALPSDSVGSMFESCDASAYITESGTYRVKASYTAGNSTVTRTSNERTFN